MINRAFILFSAIFLCLNISSPLSAEIVVNNRVLVDVKGEPISLVDVTKAMEMALYFQAGGDTSQLTDAVRMQYYGQHWKRYLEELIKKELILADAEEQKMEIATGDVRQEIENRFGRQLYDFLEESHMTYDEIFNYVKKEIAIRRMTMFKVHSQVMKKVTPAIIQQEYEKIIAELAKQYAVSFRVLTIRSEDGFIRHPEMIHLSEKLPSNEIEIDNINELLHGINPDLTASLSVPLKEDINKVKESYKDILSRLCAGQWSLPIEEEARSSGQRVYKILYLDSIEDPALPAFYEVEAQIRNGLTSSLTEKKTLEYVLSLYDHFKVPLVKENTMLINFEPFLIR